jgi:hypothetical protein
MGIVSMCGASPALTVRRFTEFCGKSALDMGMPVFTMIHRNRKAVYDRDDERLARPRRRP